MGFLSNYYNKPGPGVAKGAPKPNRFVLFWQILGRHFFDLIKANLLFLVPTIVLGALTVVISFQTQNIFLVSLPLILLAPFAGGLTYETRNYAREEHVFVWHDFVKRTKENWKKFLLNGVLFYAVTTVAITAIRFYAKNQEALGSVLSVIALAVCLGVLFLFIAMQFYVAIQIVTFEMSMKQIYKNALIFAIVGLWRNLLLVVILAAVCLGMYVLVFIIGQVWFPATFIAILITALFLFSWISYLVNFTVYPLVNKNMIQPALKRQWEEKKARGELSPEEEADFVDWDSVDDDDDDDDDDDSV